jgi:hypothetical protein
VAEHFPGCHPADSEAPEPPEGYQPQDTEDVNGDFDATKEESDAWAASPEGQETFRQLFPPRSAGGSGG